MNLDQFLGRTIHYLTILQIDPDGAGLFRCRCKRRVRGSVAAVAEGKLRSCGECRPRPAMNPYLGRKPEKLAKMILELNEGILAWGLKEALQENDISQKRIRKEVFPEYPVEPEFLVRKTDETHRAVIAR
jgi:hypothetical protein